MSWRDKCLDGASHFYVCKAVMLDEGKAIVSDLSQKKPQVAPSFLCFL